MAVTSQAGQHAPALADTLPTRQKVTILIGLLFGMLLSSLDQTIVGTAMPRVIADLGGLNHYAWVFTAYMLASTIMVPIYGKLSDIYGRRPFFLGGMIVFLLGSALSGAAQSMVQLIIFRAIQGLGAGAMMPIAIAIIGDIFAPAERGKWQGIMMAVFGLSSIVGPTLGGWLTDTWGWRWVFYVNMPVGALAIAVAWLTLPKQSRHQDHQIDYLGAGLLVAGTLPLLLAFSWAGADYAWTSPMIIGLLAAAVVLLIGFFVVESKREEAIISPALFRNSIFTVSVIASFLASIAMFGVIMYLPLFVQGVIGSSATDSGAVMTPLMLGFVASSIVAGQVLSRTGRYKALALIGFAVTAVGMLLLTQMSTATTNATVVRNMIISGLGMGIMMSMFTIVVQNAFPRELMGQVTSSLQFFRSIGGTMGVAILGTVMSTRFQAQLAANLPNEIPADKAAALQNPQLLLSPEATEQIHQGFVALGPQGEQLYQQVLEGMRLSLANSITLLFTVGVAVMVLGFITCLFLREIPLRKSAHSTSQDLAALSGEAVVE